MASSLRRCNASAAHFSAAAACKIARSQGRGHATVLETVGHFYLFGCVFSATAPLVSVCLPPLLGPQSIHLTLQPRGETEGQAKYVDVCQANG